jgi:Cys-tRNA synthase (O-phospho-L-seryl-tRNA:Cys-tRNA synthase)
MQSGSAAKTELIVGAGEKSTFAFALIPVKPMREIMQTRVYVASEGAFGLVNINLLYGKALH